MQDTWRKMSSIAFLTFFLTIGGFFFLLYFSIWWTGRRERKYFSNWFVFIWLEQQIMKHSLHIISFSAPWFQVSLDTGRVDQMFHLHAMLSKWRLKFRSTGHRTTEADCKGKWSVQLGRPGAGRSLCTPGPKGHQNSGFLRPPALSQCVAANCAFNLSPFMGGQIWKVRDTKEVRKRGKKISLQNTHNQLCWEKNTGAFSKS